MTQTELYRWLAENTKNIFGYAMTRTLDRHKAEDLASEICCAILQSAHRLPAEEEKCFRYLWQIAHHTWVDALRRENAAMPMVELTDEVPAPERTVEEQVILDAEQVRLRRELSMLSEGYRQATVLYYLEELSCREIAERMNVSTDMVKYYLFRARKMLREGMDMERTWGERSYHPQAFEIDFCGDHGGVDEMYCVLRQRKILGNILLAAYYNGLTMQELSLELGVAVAYLEDEVRWLADRALLTEKGGKYRTAIPVFTEEVLHSMNRRCAPFREKMADAVTAFADSPEGQAVQEMIRSHSPAWITDTAVRWQMLLLACHFALLDVEHAEECPATEPYRRNTGGEGFMWGRSMETKGDLDKKRDINGIYQNYTAEDGRGQVVAWNWRALHPGQLVTMQLIQPLVCVAVDCYRYLPEGWQKSMTEGGYAVDGRANFPVYTQEEYETFRNIMVPLLETLREYNTGIRQCSEEVTADIAPAGIREEAAAVGRYIYGMDGLIPLADMLVEKGWLTVETDGCKAGMFVVKAQENPVIQE